MTKKQCSSSNCSRPYKAKGLCSMHYKRLWRNGSTLKVKGGDPEIRFWAKVNKTESCWIWTGTMQQNSPYGQFWLNGKLVRPHRYSYEQSIGPIPEGLTIDHLCRNTICVNPKHLEAVTSKVNTLRGTGFAAINAKKTHCHQGHEFTKENTYSYNGKRCCRTCRSETTRKLRHAKSSSF